MTGTGVMTAAFCREARQRAPRMLDDLRAFVTHETPTGDEAACNALARELAARLAGLGAAVERHHVAGTGTHLVARAGAEGAAPVLLLGHLDTVHPAGEIARNPFRIVGEHVYGPGTQDMKGGLVAALHALGMLAATHAPAPPVVVVITCDEETGSRTSRGLIEQQATGCRAALVLEASGPGGAVKLARKGVGLYAIEVSGKAAHAGLEPGVGMDANRRLAEVLLALYSLARPAQGTTVNAGRIEGGTAANVISEHARALVDTRFRANGEMGRIDRAIRALAEEGTVTVSGGMNRPPLVPTQASQRLYRQLRDLASTLGYPLGQVSVGGASDGNFTAAMGVPTLDGLGPAGSGLHTHAERIVASELPLRAALLAAFISQLR